MAAGRTGKLGLFTSLYLRGTRIRKDRKWGRIVILKESPSIIMNLLPREILPPRAP